MIADFLFFLFSATAVVSGLFVITRENPVASVMFLVVTLFSLAGLFVLLDAHFIAAVQVIVYAGAIMVLFLFVVMLLNLGHERTAEFRGPLSRMAAGALALALAGFTARFLVGGTPAETEGGRQALQAVLDARGAVGAVAVPLFRDYLVPFEVTSLLLLVAIVGAVVLARRREP
jgi:NADH-quinone oxidoreductase subunit J